MSAEANRNNTHPDKVESDRLYGEFPSGREHGFGPEQGYGRTVRINDPRFFEAWFDDEEIGPTLRAFCGLDDEGQATGGDKRTDREKLRVYYTRFKSSTEESEYFIHKPVDYLGGYTRLEPLTPDGEEPIRLEHLQTLVMNHERTLAWRRTSSLLAVDGTDGAQLMHKET